MNTETYTGWIVDVKQTEFNGSIRNGWCGIYYKYFPPRMPAEIGELLGIRTMVFRTREQARELATYIDNSPWPWPRNAVVRKVEVTIRVIGHG